MLTFAIPHVERGIIVMMMLEWWRHPVVMWNTIVHKGLLPQYGCNLDGILTLDPLTDGKPSQRVIWGLTAVVGCGMIVGRTLINVLVGQHAGVVFRDRPLPSR